MTSSGELCMLSSANAAKMHGIEPIVCPGKVKNTFWE